MAQYSGTARGGLLAVLDSKRLRMVVSGGGRSLDRAGGTAFEDPAMSGSASGRSGAAVTARSAPLIAFATMTVAIGVCLVCKPEHAAEMSAWGDWTSGTLGSGATFAAAVLAWAALRAQQAQIERMDDEFDEQRRRFALEMYESQRAGAELTIAELSRELLATADECDPAAVADGQRGPKIEARIAFMRARVRAVGQRSRAWMGNLDVPEIARQGYADLLRGLAAPAEALRRRLSEAAFEAAEPDAAELAEVVGRQGWTAQAYASAVEILRECGV